MVATNPPLVVKEVSLRRLWRKRPPGRFLHGEDTVAGGRIGKSAGRTRYLCGSVVVSRLMTVQALVAKRWAKTCEASGETFLHQVPGLKRLRHAG